MVGVTLAYSKKMKESQRYLEDIKQGLNEVRISVVIGSVQILSLF